MIVKKMKNKHPEKSKSAHIRDTLEYIFDEIPSNPSITDRGKILWTGTHNMDSQTVDDLHLEMTAIAERSTRSKNPINHVLLSFRQGDTVTEEQIKQATQDFLSDMGYAGCQMAYAVHQNTNNVHVHMVINRIDPEKGIARSDSHDIEKMHKSIAKMCQKYGWSAEKRDRFIMVDGEEMKAEYINSTDEIVLSDNAIKSELHSGEKSAQRIAAEDTIPILQSVESWKELHDRLAPLGFVYEKKGGGAVLRYIRSDADPVEVKASTLARWASLKNMEKRLGTFRSSPIDAVPQDAKLMPSVPQVIFNEYKVAKKASIDSQQEIYREFEERKHNLQQERKQVLEIISQSDVNWEGKELALLALQKASKELYNENVIELGERYKEKLDKGKQITAKATSFDIWLQENKNKNIADSIISGIERQGNVIYIERKPITEHSIIQKIEQFKLYHNAVKADRYRITSRSESLFLDSEDGTLKPKVLILDKDKDGATNGYTPEQVIKCIGMTNPNTPRKSNRGMTNLESHKEHLYFTPLSDNKHHFFIDDLNTTTLNRLRMDGLTPACIIQSSPRNYQAIFTLDAINSPYEKAIINELATGINIKYGDMGFCGAVHPHRVPGFYNVKQKYIEQVPSYPIVSVVETSGKQCELLKQYIQYMDNYYRYKAEQSKRIIHHVHQIDTQQTNDIQKTNTVYKKKDAFKLYEIHRQAILKINKISSAIEDKSRIDSMIAVRLRATGHTRDEIEDIIIINNKANDRTKYDLEKYSKLTIDYAFSQQGDMQIEKYEKWIPQWKMLENNANNEKFIKSNSLHTEKKQEIKEIVDKQQTNDVYQDDREQTEDIHHNNATHRVNM